MRLADDPLVPIRLGFEVDDQLLQDAFCWDSRESPSAIAPFVRGLVSDLRLTPAFIHPVCQAMQAQVDAFRALHAQDLAAALGTEENVHVVKLLVYTRTRVIRDQMLWDLNNPQASPEAYASGLCRDLGIDGEDAVLVAVALREQLLEIAQQVINSRDSRSAKKPRRERAGANESKGAAALPVGGPAVAFMRRPNNKTSIFRRRREWDEYGPSVELLYQPPVDDDTLPEEVEEDVEPAEGVAGAATPDVAAADAAGGGGDETENLADGAADDADVVEEEPVVMTRQDVIRERERPRRYA